MSFSVVYLKNLYKNNRSMMNGALFAVFSFINKGFSFLLLLILASLITPSEYGYLSLYTTVTMVIGYFMAFSTEGYFPLAYLRSGEEESKKVFTNILATTLLVSLFFVLCLAVGGGYFSKALSLPLNCLYLGLLTVFLNVYVNTNLEYFRIHEQVKTYGIFSCGNAALNFVVSIIFVKSFLWGWEGRVYALTLCSALYGVYALLFFIKRGFLTKVDKRVWKEMLIWGIPLIPHLATTFIKQGCDRYIINYFYSTEEVGIFSFALNLTTIITMVGFGFNQSNSVSIYKICGNNDMGNDEKRSILQSQRKKFLGLYTIITVVIVVLCMLLIPLILPNYAPSLAYLPFLGIFGLFVCFYLVYTNYLFFYNKTKELMLITFGTSLLHLGLSLALTRFSLFYTSTIYCVSQFIVVLLVRKIAMKSLSKNLA